MAVGKQIADVDINSTTSTVDKTARIVLMEQLLQNSHRELLDR